MTPSPKVLREIKKGIKKQEAGKLDEAARIYHAVLKKHPEIHGVVYLAGIVAYQAHQYERAIPLMESAVQRMPDYAPAPYNLGRFYFDADRVPEARQMFRRALALAPDMVEAHIELGNCALYLGEVETAYRHFMDAEQYPSHTVEARFNRSFPRLLLGDYRGGFRDYESRWDLPLWMAEHGRPDLTEPKWDGSPLGDRHLFVAVEQGYGDTLMMLRYWHHPKLRDARVTWEVQSRALRLAEASCPIGHSVVPKGAVPPHDLRAHMMSLPFLCETATPDEVPAAPYLRVPDGLVYPFEREPGTTLVVGMRGVGNYAHRNNHRRSTPVEFWEPLLALPGIHWVSMDERPGEDWADTAALMNHCDIVISVDTSVAHCAGAIGRETWILLPYSPDFRWGMTSERTPWYPTARLFRQTASGQWMDVMQRVRAELAKRLNVDAAA